MPCVWCGAPSVIDGPAACPECGHWRTGDVWTADTTLREMGASVVRAWRASGHPGVAALAVVVTDEGRPLLIPIAGATETGVGALCLCGQCGEGHCGVADGR
jgi:hypothetical protein